MRQQSATYSQPRFSPAVGHESEMPDADEAWRQHVQEEPAQELAGRKRHFPFPVGMCVVLPAKGDLAVGNTHNSVIGDGDAVCVTCQIAEDLFGPSKRRLGVNHPFAPVSLTE